MNAKDSLLKNLRRQTNSIEHAIITIPPNVTNITTIQRQAISLSPRIIELSAPIKAERVVVGRLHLLLLIDLGVLGVGYLLGKYFGAGLSPSGPGRANSRYGHVRVGSASSVGSGTVVRCSDVSRDGYRRHGGDLDEGNGLVGDDGLESGGLRERMLASCMIKKCKKEEKVKTKQ